jgi:hypothetical protein
MLFSMQMIEYRYLHFGFALHFSFPNMQGAAAGRQAQKQHPTKNILPFIFHFPIFWFSHMCFLHCSYSTKIGYDL